MAEGVVFRLHFREVGKRWSWRQAIDATLSGLEQGRDRGRLDDAELTVFAPVGLPWQDLALAWPLYRQAEASGLGTQFDLLG